MKKHIMTIFSSLLGVLAIWLIFTKFPITWNQFSSFNVWLVIIWILVTLIIFMAHGYRWKIVLDAKNMKIPFWRVFLYKIIGNSVSYFTPAAKLGGEPVRALLIKKHKHSLKEALSTVVIDKAIELASSGIFFVIGIIVLLTSFALPVDLQILLLFVGILVLWAVYYYYSSMFKGKKIMVKIFRKLNLHNINKLKKYEKKLTDFEDVILKFYSHNKKAFIISIGISAITWILMFIEYKLATVLLGIDISYLGIFLIFSFVGAAYIIPVPMSLGSLEASQVGVFKILGLNTAGGLALSLLIRARDLLWGIIGLIMLSIMGFSVTKTLEEDTRIDEEIEKIK